jgi:hypothetical protein
MQYNLKNHFWNLPERTMETKKNHVTRAIVQVRSEFKTCKIQNSSSTLPKQILVYRNVLILTEADSC